VLCHGAGARDLGGRADGDLSRRYILFAVLVVVDGGGYVQFGTVPPRRHGQGVRPLRGDVRRAGHLGRVEEGVLVLGPNGIDRAVRGQEAGAVQLEGKPRGTQLAVQPVVGGAGGRVFRLVTLAGDIFVVGGELVADGR